MALRDWPAVLRAAGIQVNVHPEVNRLSHGPMRDLNIVLHHDASPPGDSPGALEWMKQNFRNSSAQVWIDRRGVWNFISFGVAYHAGMVHRGSAAWANPYAVGIETDHTTGESWPVPQLTSVRRGIAAVLKHEGKTADALNFHKIIAAPTGRKQDPAGLDLATERAAVAGATTTAAPEEDMPSVNEILMGATTVTFRDDNGTVHTETHPLAFWVGQIYDYQRTITRALEQLGAKLDDVETPTRVLFKLAGADDVYLARLDASPATWAKIPADKVDMVRSNLAQLGQKVVDFTGQAPVTDPHIYGAEVEWDGAL